MRLRYRILAGGVDNGSPMFIKAFFRGTFSLSDILNIAFSTLNHVAGGADTFCTLFDQSLQYFYTGIESRRNPLQFEIRNPLVG